MILSYLVVLNEHQDAGIEHAISYSENKSDGSLTASVWAFYMPPRLILRLGVPFGTSLFLWIALCLLR
jgi:hypothetical protein